MASAQRRLSHQIFLPAIACALITACLMTWPADAPWGGDDVVLISTAIRANLQHRLITAGLGGSFGYPYGPIPSQIYQLLALITQNPINLVQLHAGLFAAVTAFSLLYLTNVLNLNPWLAPLTMLGPFFWFYTRLLWDNPFAMPFGTLLLASYLDWLRRRSSAPFFTAAVCAVALPLIHPMTLPLVMAVAGHALVFRRAAFREHWRGLVIIAIIACVLAGPYAIRIVDQIGHSAALIPPREDALSRPAAAAFPLFSGRLFCAKGFFDQRGPELGYEQHPLFIAARAFTLVAYPLIWLGIIRCLILLRRGSAAAIICLTTLALQSIMDAALRISPYPHYYTGTWAAAVFLLWLGLESLAVLKLRLLITIAYASALIVATAAFALDIHSHSGGTVWYGPTIGVQPRQ